MADSCLFAYGRTADGNRLEVHVDDDGKLRLYTGSEGSELDPVGAAGLMQMLRVRLQQPDVPEWVRAMGDYDIATL